ncbi:PEP-CTERM sorting domain-containing protein [Geobacter pickeringii]|uniref:Ice-binding protein C-terminal domain-containing protein n=1 Tax=Geobacter pickeringii TaxID=345632 RepID=A0A0B5BG73_9BACT|nr:PEP-CTERM sorting domain-containing protein [Geobacter pickeringii]AJE04134.1 hypothetical protein GPICK_12900 [Geobacter pickeringii]
MKETAKKTVVGYLCLLGILAWASVSSATFISVETQIDNFTFGLTNPKLGIQFGTFNTSASSTVTVGGKVRGSGTNTATDTFSNPLGNFAAVSLNETGSNYYGVSNPSVAGSPVPGGDPTINGINNNGLGGDFVVLASTVAATPADGAHVIVQDMARYEQFFTITGKPRDKGKLTVTADYVFAMLFDNSVLGAAKGKGEVFLQLIDTTRNQTFSDSYLFDSLDPLSQPANGADFYTHLFSPMNVFGGDRIKLIAEARSTSDAAPVPEPGTVMLVGAGILGLVLVRRRI